MADEKCPLPHADGQVGLQALQALWQKRSPLGALEVMQSEVGRAFQLNLPGFRPAVLAGPVSNRYLLVTGRDQLLWRTEADPVTRLLRHGVLVEDGDSHDYLRAQMDPVLQKPQVAPHVPQMWQYTDAITRHWRDGDTLDMLDEMRRVALLILIGTLFQVDFRPDLERLWQPILKMLRYIAPGLWVVWPGMPRPGYRHSLQAVDDYLYQIIRDRRADMAQGYVGEDLLTRLVQNPDMSDDLIRDQLLTMLIAGHDTSTALFAWMLYLLGRHPAAMAQAQAEVDAVVGRQPPTLAQLGDLAYLDLVIKETLRLYPPIHVGNRRAPVDLTVAGYHIPAGTRIMYSIYLSHRDAEYWPDPAAFRPERFAHTERGQRPAFAYVPFGGGPRNCIGAAYAQIEAKVVFARLLQQFDLTLTGPPVHAYMGATLEPRPGVFMHIRRR